MKKGIVIFIKKFLILKHFQLKFQLQRHVRPLKLETIKTLDFKNEIFFRLRMAIIICFFSSVLLILLPVSFEIVAHGLVLLKTIRFTATKLANF